MLVVPEDIVHDFHAQRELSLRVRVTEFTYRLFVSEYLPRRVSIDFFFLEFVYYVRPELATRCFNLVVKIRGG